MRVINTLSLPTINIKFALVIGLYFCSGFVFSQVMTEVKVKASLKVEATGGLIDVAGIAENQDNIFQSDLEYVLLALKTSSTNTLSKDTQEGLFSLAPNENKLLNTLKISMQKDELLKLFLFVRKENKLISKDTLVISSKTRQGSLQEDEGNFEIKGLVVDEVITKLGKDFYDYFYQKYSANSTKYPFVIKIVERPKIGINSEIIIKIDDEEVYTMNSNPNQEYLEASAQQALFSINQYYQRRQLLKQTNRKF